MKIQRDTASGSPLSRFRRATAALAGAFLFVMGPGEAAAQDLGLFRLTKLDGLLELGFLAHIEERPRTRAPNSEFNRVELSQRLEVSGGAFVYHPRFLTLEAGLQVETIEGLLDDGDNRVLFGGNWNLNFLGQHRNSLSVFGKIVQSEVQRPFSPTYEVTNQMYGTTFYHRWGWIPFDLTYQHRSEEGGLEGDLDDVSDEIIFHGTYDIGEDSTGKLDYKLAFEEVLDRDVRRQELLAFNSTYFGDDLDKRLTTTFRFDEEDNSRHRITLDGRTDFDWRHTENLSSGYAMDARWNDAEVQTITSLGSSFFLTHKLYESLTTHTELFGRHLDASFGKRSEFGGRLVESYVKNLGDWGHLSARFSPRISMTANRPDQDTALAIEERYTMEGLDEVRLRRADIIESSIVVTNESGSIVYDPGPLRDYEIIQRDGGLETFLRRTPTSDIADGEVVLVSYEFELTGKSDVLTSGYDVNFALALFRHAEIYSRWENGDQTVLSGDEEDLRLVSFNRAVTGFTLDWPWISTRAEYENYDATFGSFEGYRGSVSVFTYGDMPWQARVNASYAFRDHTDSNEEITRLALSGSFSRRVFRRGLVEFNGNYTRERWSGVSSDANDVDMLFLETGFTWWYGKIEVELEGGMAQILREAENKRVYGVDLRVRRRF